MLRASKYSQLDLLEVKPKQPNLTPVMTTKFNSQTPNIKGFIHDNWNIIEHSNDCAPTFPDKPIIGFKRLPNLRDLLTKASTDYPPKPLEAKPLIPTHCLRLAPSSKNLMPSPAKSVGTNIKPKTSPNFYHMN